MLGFSFTSFYFIYFKDNKEDRVGAWHAINNNFHQLVLKNKTDTHLCANI
jgi:hypothetical protein